MTQSAVVLVALEKTVTGMKMAYADTVSHAVAGAIRFSADR